MTEFAQVVRDLMARNGSMSLRALAAAAHQDAGQLSRVLNGKRPHTPALAAALDQALGAAGAVIAAAENSPPPPPRPTSPRLKKSLAVEALQLAMRGDTDELAVAEDGLAELIRHYAHTLALSPSPTVHSELLAVRSFAGTLLTRARPSHPGLIADAGWLSSLLAISASDLGDHPAALIWCADTERRAHEAGHPELLGWAALTRAVIAYYQGDARRSADTARQGQQDTAQGTVAYLKLASQEMRSRAMLGDTEGMRDASRRARIALENLGPDIPRQGVYSAPTADNPPYTATSLLLTGHYRQAEEMTRHLLASAYGSRGAQPTNYARTLLILALAAAGQGNADEADALGAAALDASPVVWPTMMLARRLNSSLSAHPRAVSQAGFRDRYRAVTARAALPQGRRRP